MISKLWRKLTLRNGAAWRFALDGGTKAGVTVDEDAVLRLSTAWSCIRIISQTAATLPCGFFSRDAGGGRTEVDDHWLAEILRVSPNSEQTPVEFLEGVFGSLALRGNYFARKAGLRPDGSFASLETMLDVTWRRENGERVWTWNTPDGERVTLRDDEVFVVKGFGVGHDFGLSPIGYARETFGAGVAADEQAAKLFASGLQGSGFFQTNEVLTDPQRAQAEKALGQFVDSNRAGRFMILEGGVTWQPLGMKPDEAQLLLTRRFHVEEICRWYGVPPILVGHASEGQTMWGSGVEQIVIGWLTFGLRPYLVRIEQAIRKRALPAAERSKFYAEFNVEGLMRADSAGRAALYSAFAQNGVMSRNDIRRRENLTPSKDPNGDALTVQSNLVRLEDLGKGSLESESALKEGFRRWLDLKGAANAA